MRAFYIFWGIFLLGATNAAWLSTRSCKGGYIWGPVTVDNGNCVPGYFPENDDRLLVSCSKGEIQTFRCVDSNCQNCQKLRNIIAENGVCTNSTTDPNYIYHCSNNPLDFRQIVGSYYYMTEDFFASNATKCRSDPWRTVVRPVGECYDGTYNDNYQSIICEKYTARIIMYKDPVCQTYRNEEDHYLHECSYVDDYKKYWNCF